MAIRIKVVLLLINTDSDNISNKYTMNKILLFLAPGFEEIEAISIIDVLRRAQLDVTSVSIAGDLSVTGAHGITVEADTLLPDITISEAGMIILPGGMPGTKNLNVHEGLKTAIKKFAQDGKPIAAICAAPMILGQLGILDGKSATCYPGNEQFLTGAKIQKMDIVRDGKIITGNGPGSAIKFALEIVSMLSGDDLAKEIASGMMIK